MARLIPRRFLRLWYGPDPIPPRYLDYAQTWVDHNDDWTIETLVGYRPYLNRDVWDGCGVTWEANAGGGKQHRAQQVQRADIASYDLLFQRGGVYLNCDMEALRPIAPIVEDVDCFLVWEHDGHFISNAVMGATPGHPFLGHVLELLPKRVAAFPGRPMNEQTGPHLLTEAYKTYDGEKPVVFPSDLFMPFGYGEMHRSGDAFPDAYAVHHWGHRVPDDELWSDA